MVVPDRGEEENFHVTCLTFLFCDRCYSPLELLSGLYVLNDLVSFYQVPKSINVYLPLCVVSRHCTVLGTSFLSIVSKNAVSHLATFGVWFASILKVPLDAL